MAACRCMTTIPKSDCPTPTSSIGFSRARATIRSASSCALGASPSDPDRGPGTRKIGRRSGICPHPCFAGRGRSPAPRTAAAPSRAGNSRLLETVATAFRGQESGTGTIEGKYFNEIVRALRNNHRGSALAEALGWMSKMHGIPVIARWRRCPAWYPARSRRFPFASGGAPLLQPHTELYQLSPRRAGGAVLIAATGRA